MKLRTNLRPRRPRSASARPAMTYYRSAGKAADSPFMRRSSKPSLWRRVLMGAFNGLLILLVLAGLFYSLIVSSTPKVTVSSDLYHPRSIYYRAVSKQLGLLKNRNKITFDENSVANHLSQQFPEISKTQIELPILNQAPKFHIEVAGPSIFLISQGSRYIINEQGLAVTKSENLPQIKNLVTVTDEANLAMEPGKRVLSANQISSIQTLVAQLQKAKVSIKSLSLPTQSQQLDFRTTDHDYYVKFLLGGDDLQQIGQFLAGRHQFDKGGAQPAEYLDVRVPGKIFYK